MATNNVTAEKNENHIQFYFPVWPWLPWTNHEVAAYSRLDSMIAVGKLMLMRLNEIAVFSGQSVILNVSSLVIFSPGSNLSLLS